MFNYDSVEYLNHKRLMLTNDYNLTTKNLIKSSNQNWFPSIRRLYPMLRKLSVSNIHYLISIKL